MKKSQIISELLKQLKSKGLLNEKKIRRLQESSSKRDWTFDIDVDYTYDGVVYPIGVTIGQTFDWDGDGEDYSEIKKIKSIPTSLQKIIENNNIDYDEFSNKILDDLDSELESEIMNHNEGGHDGYGDNGSMSRSEFI